MREHENQITPRERGQRIVKDHDPFSSTPFVGIGVGDRKYEQAQGERVLAPKRQTSELVDNDEVHREQMIGSRPCRA
jgi:hypothetical protein